MTWIARSAKRDFQAPSRLGCALFNAIAIFVSLVWQDSCRTFDASTRVSRRVLGGRAASQERCLFGGYHESMF